MAWADSWYRSCSNRCRSTWSCCSASSTARSRTTRPTPSSSRTCATSWRAFVKRETTSACASTRAATACAALSGRRKPFERYAASGELNTRVDDPLAVIGKVAAAYRDAQQDRLDGLTVDFGDWWFNLRPSNTEPLLRLNLEARTPAEVEAHVAEVQAVMGES